MSRSLEFLEYLAYLNNRIKADGGETTTADTEARYFLFCDFWSGNPDRVVTTQRIPRYGRTTEERATITTERGQTVGYVDIPASKVFLGFETVTKSRTEYSHFVRLDLVDSKTITASNGYPMWTCVGFYTGSQPALEKIVPFLATAAMNFRCKPTEDLVEVEVGSFSQEFKSTTGTWVPAVNTNTLAHGVFRHFASCVVVAQNGADATAESAIVEQLSVRGIATEMQAATVLSYRIKNGWLYVEISKGGKSLVGFGVGDRGTSSKQWEATVAHVFRCLEANSSDME